MALQMKMGYQIDDKTLLDLHSMPDLPQGARRYRARHTTFLVAFALLFWYVVDHIEIEYISKKEQWRDRMGASINDKLSK